MSASGSLWLIPALPLLGAALNLFVGKRLGRSAGIVASVLVAASFVVSIAVVGSLLGLGAQERVQTQQLFEWIHVGSFSVGATLRLDPLSATMILVVTGIGLLIHIYAVGYMRDDPRYGRFFAYMNLFVFFMLMLVLGQNLLVLYLGWEGVGLCSYLLIGFWFEKTENANAAKKAFVTTRIGDTAMLIGLALIAVKFGTLDYSVIFGTAGSTLTKSAATAIALLLFAGAIGKSAQVPLHVWLPDAMAGPTPVSALIHAATMVTAGVYLVLRMHVIFEISGRGAHRGRGGRCRDDALRGDVRVRPGRHQARPRVLHDQPARVHVHRGGAAGVLDRALHAGRARVLQGADVPRRRLGHARDARPHGHEADGRTAAADARHRRHVRGRRAGAGRRLPALGVLRQGRDPRGGEQHRAHVAVHPRRGRGAHLRAVHRAAGVPDVLRPAAIRGGGARP